MPVYKFRGPDGQSYDITAPEGMPEAAAYEQFAAYWKQSRARPAGVPGGPKTEGQKKLEAEGATRAAGAAAAQDNSGTLQVANPFGSNFDTGIPVNDAVGSVLANLGAGFSKLGRGVRDIFPGGRSDAEKQDSRIRDEALADSTTGGGLLQTAAEVGPTLAIPAGGFVKAAGAGLRGAQAAGRAMVGAAPQAASAAAGAARMGTAAAATDAALAGGVMGAAQERTSDESRLGNAALGAALGGVLPFVVAGGKGLYQMLSMGGAEQKAAERLINEVGGIDAAQALVDKIKNAPRAHPAVENIPLTTAETTGNAALGVAERRSAAANPAPWTDFRATQRSAKADALFDITRGADDLDARVAARDTATAPLRGKALSAAAQDPWFHEPVVQASQRIAQSGGGANPAVQSVLGYVDRELSNGITPERLYEVRKVLVDKLGGPKDITDALGASVKTARAQTMEIVNAIDTALEQASKGKWKDVNGTATANQARRKYMNEYSRLSRPVDDATASSKLRDYYLGEGGPRTIDAAGNEIPSVTGTNLGRQMEKLGSNGFGETWQMGTRDGLDALLATVRKSELLQAAIKNAGTSGGGSNTAMDVASLVRNAQMLPNQGIISQIAGAAGNRSTKLQMAALTDALQNPQLFVRGVEKKIAAGAPLTKTEEHVMNVLRAASAATPAALTQQ